MTSIKTNIFLPPPRPWLMLWLSLPTTLKTMIKFIKLTTKIFANMKIHLVFQGILQVVLNKPR